MRLAEFFQDCATFAVRLERMAARPLLAPRLCTRLHGALAFVIEHLEEERGIDWYRPETWPENRKGAAN